MNLERELEAVMKAGAQWQGSEDALWDRVAGQIKQDVMRPRRRLPVWSAAVAVAAVIAGVMLIRPALLSRPPAVHPPQAGGPKQLIPSVSATLLDVKDGYLVLKDVTYSLNPGQQPPDPARIAVPKGRWLTANHWQSEGESVDLFRDQSIVYFIESKVIMPEVRFGKGEVLSRDGQSVKVKVTEGSPDAASHNGVMVNVQVDPGVYTFHVAPYRRLDRPFKAGDQVIVGVFGVPGDEIVWQATFLN